LGAKISAEFGGVMNQAVLDVASVLSSGAPQPAREDPYSLLFRFTVEQYQQLLEVGILEEGSSWELLDGMISHKNRADAGKNEMTHGPEHASRVAQLIRLLDRAAERVGLELRCQLPLQLSLRDAPEPDFALIMPLSGEALNRHPQGHEVSLVIEVASSSLKFDRTQKQAVYAKAGIPEYWIVNLLTKQLEVFQVPDTIAGEYQQIRSLSAGEQIELTGITEHPVTLQVADLV
jgi:Uma2 family endonuclease